MKNLELYLVSDSTGETVSRVSKACLAQFEGVTAHENVWSLVRTEDHVRNVLENVQEHPGIVVCTMVDKKLQNFLREECRALDIPCVLVLEPLINVLTSHLGQEVQNEPGKQHQLDAEYFDRIDAIEYALQHDDGQSMIDWGKAEVVLVGVSRTSKTPTCMYLAYKGIRAANVPYVPGVPLPDQLFENKKALVVGLIAKPDRLIQIRTNRLLQMAGSSDSDYTDPDKVEDEVQESKRFFQKQGWPVIDVSRRSIEETVATIVNLYQKHREKRATENG